MLLLLKTQDYSVMRNPSRDDLVYTAWKPWVAVGMRNVDYKWARHFEVDLSAFRNILDIGKERMIVRCEPLVNTGQISRVSVPMNPAFVVVAELDVLIGGLINGYGIEGSSHSYGLFSDTVVAYEIILADGQLVKAQQYTEEDGEKEFSCPRTSRRRRNAFYLTTISPPLDTHFLEYTQLRFPLFNIVLRSLLPILMILKLLLRHGSVYTMQRVCLWMASTAVGESLLEFDLPGGIPESCSKLPQALNLDYHENKQSAAALQVRLVKLQEENLSAMNTDPWYLAYHYSQPPLVERLAALGEPDKKED
ncbi:hypothetical protein VitviT2T_023369 [Vitis vinifera]|uniref:FAD linked oxidase N-terminal domain-containing protein n=1 Tax=Vitis vinifera TaxID=29760 RepID=A0ABY9DF81_VITVI|nr:hypothetical protein VitviT2T_023369 [Vitis vinifera]